jgi:hypothetical protein
VAVAQSVASSGRSEGTSESLRTVCQFKTQRVWIEFSMGIIDSD